MGVGSSVPMGCEAVVEEDDEATSGDGWRLGSGEPYLKLLGVLWLSVGCIGGLPMEVWETRDLCLGLDCARDREEAWDPRVGREQVQRSTCSHSPCTKQSGVHVGHSGRPKMSCDAAAHLCHGVRYTCPTLHKT